MEFPDGRVVLFENNKFLGPNIDSPKLRDLKAQEILLHRTISTVKERQPVQPHARYSDPENPNKIRIKKSRAKSRPKPR